LIEVVERHITLLVENFHDLGAAAGSDQRNPALELILSRGAPVSIASPTIDHLRFHLFGIQPEGTVPVAALTHVNDRGEVPPHKYFWLRSDPVTVWADMARAFMASHGFADLNPYERNEIEICIRKVLEDEGIHLHSDHPERWCIALQEPLDFEFTSLDEALGMDLADALPHHREALHWKRILNEVQVALSNCPVNVRRRQSGGRQINSVWFWGGGFMPDAVSHDVFDTVYSDNAVTRGLSIINDCRLKKRTAAEQAHFSQDGRTILIDWEAETDDPATELKRLEWLVTPLIAMVKQNQAVITLYDGSGQGRMLDRSLQKRIWRRRKPLFRLLPTVAEA
jgi:hypothetical protein